MQPNFIVIGAMKAGTTSLWSYLRQHPAVFMPQIKEVDFFSAHWEKAWSWYQSQFNSIGPSETAVGEASTTYSRHPWIPETADRMAQCLPSAQLIYCLRDPLERIRSMYVHCIHAGHEDRSFSEAMQELSTCTNDYVAMSSYHYQLQRYLRYFQFDQIHFVVLEELRRNPAQVLRSLCQYLKIDDTFEFDVTEIRNLSEQTRRENSPLGDTLASIALGDKLLRQMPGSLQILYHRVTTKPIEKPVFSVALRDALIDQLRPDIEALRSLTGLALTDWQV